MQFGDPGDVPIPGDYNGDGVTDSRSSGRRPANGSCATSSPSSSATAGDVPVPADYNGDGITDIAVYRPSTGQWFVRNQFAVQFGDVNDMPVPGDYNGDGRMDVAVYRPSTGSGSYATSSPSSSGIPATFRSCASAAELQIGKTDITECNGRSTRSD